jgi:hypothetical protein
MYQKYQYQSQEHRSRHCAYCIVVAAQPQIPGRRSEYGSHRGTATATVIYEPRPGHFVGGIDNGKHETVKTVDW